MLLYREDLDSMKCFVPGCRQTHREGEVFLHSLCHVAAPCWAHYRGDVLTVSCSVCGKNVACVVVASRVDEGRAFEGT